MGPKKKKKGLIKLITIKEQKETKNNYNENISFVINKIKDRYKDLDKGIRFCWKK
jgi:hypothetical protein